VSQNLKRFENKVVVVTGGSRGIGLGIAERFAQEGAKVCVSANEKGVFDAAAQLRESGFDAIAVETDVTDKTQVKALYEEVAAKLGEVDVSIQNAGVITIAKLEDLSEADWDKVLAVNTKGVFLCCQEAAGRMLRAGK
jgi:meso-butanediol dehydrogenase / (S,S)-butanediol dehydrogenase / diacetyl reductase